MSLGEELGASKSPRYNTAFRRLTFLWFGAFQRPKASSEVKWDDGNGQLRLREVEARSQGMDGWIGLGIQGSAGLGCFHQVALSCCSSSPASQGLSLKSKAGLSFPGKVDR